MLSEHIDEWADRAVIRSPEPGDYLGLSRDELIERAAAICIAAALSDNYQYVGEYLDQFNARIRLN